MRLDMTAYRPTESMDSLEEFKSIAGTNASVPWHSPRVSQACARDADLQMMRDAKASPDGWRSVRMAWLGCICNVTHRFLLKMDKNNHTCLLGGFYFDDSSVLVIEYKTSSIPGHPLK